MFRRSRTYVFIISLITVLSCSEDDEKKNKGGIFPIKPGNYWIYRTTVTSADGEVSVFQYLDSVWVEKDTVINNRSYWMQTGTLSATVYLRDSADCVLMRQLTYEQIIYSTNRDTLVRNPPAYRVITNINEITEVPAGRFKTINCRTILRKLPNDGHGSDYPSFNENFYTGEQYICSEDVGLVKNIYYYLGGTIEYELIRYKLQ